MHGYSYATPRQDTSHCKEAKPHNNSVCLTVASVISFRICPLRVTAVVRLLGEACKKMPLLVPRILPLGLLGPELGWQFFYQPPVCLWTLLLLCVTSLPRLWWINPSPSTQVLMVSINNKLFILTKLLSGAIPSIGLLQAPPRYAQSNPTSCVGHGATAGKSRLMRAVPVGLCSSNIIRKESYYSCLLSSYSC